MSKKLPVSILFLNLMIVLLCGFESIAEEIDQSANANVYEVSEFLDEAQYNEYMNDAGLLFDKLLAFRRRLADSSDFAFCSFANNFIEVIDREIPKMCVVNHSTEYEGDSQYEIDGERITAAEAIQVSDRFFTLFPLKICVGRSFEPSDFDCQNAETIPVILGDAYRESFHLGDTFEGYYICERSSFTVVGFTDAESVFYLRGNNCMAPYGRFIIMPFENIEEDSYSARAILLQQICGFVATHGSGESASETIRAYLTESGLENWYGAITVYEKSLQEKMNGWTNY